MAEVGAVAMVENVVVYLVGFAGTGKLTIARTLAPLLGARVVDNHWVANPILGLLCTDGVTPLPAAVWDRVAAVRDAVLETVATLAAPRASFVFTHAGLADEPADQAVYAAIARTAARRGASFVPVRLLCDGAELARRVTMPERAALLKSIDPVAALTDSRTRRVLLLDHPNLLTLDVSALAPAASAGLIHRHVVALAGAGDGGADGGS